MRFSLSVLILAFSSMVPSTFGQSFTFTDFSNLTDLSVVGDAAMQPTNSLRLANATFPTFTSRGAVWHTTRQDVVGGFDTTFAFRLDEADQVSANGIVFVVQDIGPNELSTDFLGYGLTTGGFSIPADPGIPNSLAVEFDAVTDQVSVHTGGPGNNTESELLSIGRADLPVDVADPSVTYQARIRSVAGTLEVYFDDLMTPLLSISYDFATGGTYLVDGMPSGGLSLPDGNAYVGFTAGAAGSFLISGPTGFGSVELESWAYGSATPSVPACYEGTVDDGMGGIADILTVNGSAGGIDRTVDVGIGAAFALELAQPPTNTNPSSHVIFGRIGTADGTGSITVSFGTLCFPASVTPIQPIATFVVTNTFGAIPSPMLQATQTPFIANFPAGLPFATTVTLQGIVVNSQTPFTLAMTNAVVLAIG